MNDKTEQNPPIRRRWKQFSLRAILLLTTVAAVVLGIWTNRVRNQRLSVAVLETFESNIQYERTWLGKILPESLVQSVDDDWFSVVTQVRISYRTIDREMVTISQQELVQGVAAMSKLPYLISLSFNTCDLQDDDLLLLAPLSGQLEELSFYEAYHAALTGNSLQHLSSFSKLKRLNFYSHVDESAFSGIESLDQLETISIGKGNLNERALRSLARCKSLKLISLSECRFEGELLHHLRSLPKLETLLLQNISPKIDIGAYTIDEQGKQVPLGPPSYRFEQWYEFENRMAPQHWTDEQQQQYDQWLKDQLPSVEVNFMYSS